jgi:hypothetical protein
MKYSLRSLMIVAMLAPPLLALLYLLVNLLLFWEKAEPPVELF